MLSLILFASFLLSTTAEVKNFELLGAIPNDNSYEVALKNSILLNYTLQTLVSGDEVYVPNSTYWLAGGIFASNLINNKFTIDGTLSFSDDREKWPTTNEGDVLECIQLENIENITFTSNGKGTFNGNGKEWWGAIDFLKYQENRPRLLHIITSKNVLVENLLFKDSPYWTFWAEDCDGMVIRYCDVDARWTNATYHTYLDLQAFNTDGFDVTGRDVYIHDCNIWNQDDCISVKDGSQHMLFERISCSGLGLVIGSIGSSIVHNITFRDSVLPNTVKGIYMKTRWRDDGPVGKNASITDITYENLVMDNPQQFAIWIGPAQQTGQPCSLLWPITPHATCDISGYQTWNNIVIRNVTINNPWQSPGVLMGNLTNPIHNVFFHDVVVNNPPQEPWEDYYSCDNVIGYASGTTSPIPPCFKVIDA